ncbi:SMP-30/gluconolactonase/LRE family protein [Quadrisphaera oryzae]|uniref:SMP-30/gluconolactonase/LRE family protein n=1 Tax=Quadrisphaera TaxID=317661 RepID=UPI001647F275|nr:SMP-30/gluconolactonase/LRE family protein [Quadrisphaera sp. RL12-1S]MBC3760119.1 SMP-30/gluconolactonase/LRE family protein [Quadrisphaera sp. RL12-1S]
MGDDDDAAAGAGAQTGVDEALAPLLAPGARLEHLVGGSTWTEGPVWLPDEGNGGVVRFSDIPGDRILFFEPATGASGVHRSGVEHTNGRARWPGGGVVQCSHGLRRVELEQTGPDGEPVVTELVSSYRGARLNSPNDVVVDAAGSVWFTDPTYGLFQPGEGHPGEREYGGCHVFRLDPDGQLEAVATDFEQPNGLAFSPDEARLYVADTGVISDRAGDSAHHVRAFDVVVGDDGRRHLTGGAVLHVCERGVVDGFRVDAEGRLWCSSEDAVLVLAPSGALLGRIAVPEKVSNACFGPDNASGGQDLYVTASTSLYRIATAVRSAEPR